MIQVLHPRIRILMGLVCAFLASGLFMSYSVGETETLAPQIQVQSIVGDFSQSLSDKGSSILSSIQSFKLPTLISISSPEPVVSPPPEPEQEPTPIEWDTEPTSPPESPTSTPAYFPTDSPRHQPTSGGPRPTQYSPPPNSPKPTTIPKPTKVPKPTSHPPITTDIRPGASIEEIAREVSKRACFPYALLMATHIKESGPWLKNLSASLSKKYNTYGWWKSASSGEVCSGLAYYTQSGLIPPDSGGGSCTNGVQPDAYDQKIMGLMQVSEEEEQKTRKYTQVTLPNSIDRRVLFDNALIYAIATKNRIGTTPKNCDDWPQETVKLAAEKHFGACAYGSGKNYCTEVWDLYRSFK